MDRRARDVQIYLKIYCELTENFIADKESAFWAVMKIGKTFGITKANKIIAKYLRLRQNGGLG